MQPYDNQCGRFLLGLDGNGERRWCVGGYAVFGLGRAGDKLENPKKKLKFSNIDLYSIIEDVNIEVASNINVLFSHPSISGTIIFNSNLEHIEQELKNKFKKDYKIICLSSEEWIETKNNFIKNKNKIYEYIPETTEPEEKNTEKNDAMEIFGEELVEIK